MADYAGPQGWLGFAEFIGWIAICVAAGLAVAALLADWRQGGLRRYASALMAMALVAAFTYGPLWLGLDAPGSAKRIFTSTVQIVGPLATAALILWLGWIAWSDRRSA